MKKNYFIKQCSGWLLLLVFTISITPGKFFHDLLFPRHQDQLFIKNITSEKEQLTQHKSSCGFVNIVALKPFVPSGSIAASNEKQFELFWLIPAIAGVEKQNVSVHLLRGPPQA